MNLAGLVRSGAVLLCILACSETFAQQNVDNQFKEIKLAANAFSLADPIPTWVDPTTIPDVTEPQPIVIRLADTQFLVDRVPVVYVRRATLINDAASLTAAGRLSIAFAPEYERVQLHAIHIHRGQDLLDRTSTSTIRFLQREQGLEQGVYSGRVTASILIDDLRVGDTLDVSYSTYGQNPVFGGKYASSAGWDQPYPTQLRRVVFNHPVDRQIAWRMIGDRPAQPIVPGDTIRGGMRRIEFEQRSLPETVGEAQMFSDFFAFRFLQFSEFSSWADVANWANTLFQATSLGDDLQQVVRRIRALDSDQARVIAALEFVQTQIRYFSVSLGESSHRPAPPDEVQRRRYGDCKDKSFLLIALLRELGIQGKPVLLQAGRRTGLEKTLPSAQFFDHAIVQVALDGKTFYLDPTRLGQHGRLDRMGQAHEGAQILLVAPDTDELSTISTGNITELAREDASERATLANFADEGQLETKRTWNGVAAENARVMFERVSHDQFLQWIGGVLERRYPGAKLAGEPTISDDQLNNVFSITANYKVPKLAVDRSGNWVVYFSPDNLRNVLVPAPTATRTTPLRIPGYPYQGTYSFEMLFPEVVSIVSDPRAETVDSKYFNATVSAYFRGNIAKVSVSLATLRPYVDAGDSAKYTEDLRSTDKAIGGFFVVGKSGIKSSEAATKGLAQRLRDLRQEVIEKTTETIKNGKLSGADLAEAYCTRSNAMSDLQRHEEALLDANEAVRLAPNSTDILGCRALAYFNNGQFAKSVADYTKAVSLGAKEANVYRLRAASRLYLGRLEDAKADLERGSDLADKEAKTYYELWLVAVCGRIGQSMPDSIVKQAAAEAHGEWPRPALAMLTGSMSPDELLTLMDQKKGDERQMALAEGYFYLGQHYLVTGDNKTAQTYFEKTRDLDVFIYIEHVAAGFELERLKNASAVTSAAPSAAKPAVAQ
jgi:lipoprotein NlpI/transglutaminase-like putative cysteine protease